MIVKKNPDFGKHELNVESRGILRCFVPQDNLVSQLGTEKHPLQDLSYPAFSRDWLQNELVILGSPFPRNLSDLVMGHVMMHKWKYETMEENCSTAVS